MTEPLPQSPDDSIDWLSTRAVNAENERLKTEIRRLNEIIETLKEMANAGN
jgi:hypothetical protein